MTIHIEIKAESTEFIPTKAHFDDAAYDVRASISEAWQIRPGERITVPIGIKLGLPEGYEAIITPRSGMASKQGITIVNSPGTIDAGYRGEIAVTLLNTDLRNVFVINPKDRIAQIKIKKVLPTMFIPVETLNETERGENGFGSTGEGKLKTKLSEVNEDAVGFARYITEQAVKDPDTNSIFAVTMFKDENSGAIFGVDSSFLEDMDELIIREPFNQTLIRLTGV